MLYLELAEEINRIAKLDQEMRQRSITDENEWDSLVDHTNTEILRGIIADIGWPTIGKVGQEASKNAWLIAQHSDHDIAFQKDCLQLMMMNETDCYRAGIAYLQDRILVSEGKPQIYGTQFYTNTDGKTVPRPVYEFDKLDELRMSMGLGSFAEYLAIMHKHNSSPE